MDSGKGEASQAGDAGQAGDEDIQSLIAAFEAAQDQELNRIDAALGNVERADSREEAVAALIRATVGINALYASTATAAPLEISFPHSYSAWRAYPPYASFSRFHLLPKSTERKWDERLERYLKDANALVEKYGPDQYQLSVGFPQLVSVTLTWNVKK